MTTDTTTPPPGVTRIDDFGQLPDGRAVPQYRLSNGRGITMDVIALGGIVVTLRAPGRDGQAGNVVLGPVDVKQILEPTSSYLGALIGRVGNRIGGAAFTLDGRRYALAANNGTASLHGGVAGYDKRLWAIEPTIVAGVPAALRLTLTDPSGTEGYPGTVAVEVTYALTADDTWRIDYSATTDAPTPINLTQHTYFNLRDGGRSPILDHTAKLHAAAYTPSGADLVPAGEIAPVAGTPLDYREAKPVGRDFAKLTCTPIGVDDNFTIDAADGHLRVAAEVFDPHSGRTMTVRTTEPGIQFYTGNFLDGTLRGPDGFAYQQHTGFCLETQHYPNSPNVPAFPNTILRPGETYQTRTEYQFGVR